MERVDWLKPRYSDGSGAFFFSVATAKQEGSFSTFQPIVKWI